MSQARVHDIPVGKYRLIERNIRTRVEVLVGDYDSLDEAEKAQEKAFGKKKPIGGAPCWFSYTVYNDARKIIMMVRATKTKMMWGLLTKTNLQIDHY